ncbi:unnamed protein product [Paramecium primaurelia]|uniref:Uncharacterized protein n=1 Tax=Paramecium primaurelia TaxID=5886 RepID=A0A8S1MWT4_PARPR|nr:unnamed protein product [Paramecium primaurelia]
MNLVLSVQIILQRQIRKLLILIIAKDLHYQLQVDKKKPQNLLIKQQNLIINQYVLTAIKECLIFYQKNTLLQQNVLIKLLVLMLITLKPKREKFKQKNYYFEHQRYSLAFVEMQNELNRIQYRLLNQFFSFTTISVQSKKRVLRQLNYLQNTYGMAKAFLADTIIYSDFLQKWLVLLRNGIYKSKDQDSGCSIQIIILNQPFCYFTQSHSKYQISQSFLKIFMEQGVITNAFGGWILICSFQFELRNYLLFSDIIPLEFININKTIIAFTQFRRIINYFVTLIRYFEYQNQESLEQNQYII